MVKYSCERCGKEFSQKSHYDTHNKRITPCENNADKIKALVDKAVEEKINELNNKNLIIVKEKVNDNTTDIDKSLLNKTSNNSPLRYPGGKTRACKKLDTILKTHFDISKFNNIVSPFFGGGSFEFHIQNNYGLNIIANDKFVPLYNFWKTCKLDKENLCKELIKKIDLIDKKEFNNLRDKIMTENNKLNQSIMYFIINRCSFSGATLSGGFSLEASKKRFTKSSIDKINNLELSSYDIYNLDFEEFINNNQDEKNLLFLDPPYYLEKTSTLYGNNGDMHDTFEHDKLYKCLSKKKNWFMTYNNCNYIKNLYKDFKIIETFWSYGMNKTKKSSEIIIIG
jgi:DNA adenine methylase